MQVRELKRLIEAGAYEPDPSLVADALLRRRTVMEFLLPGAGPAAARRSGAPSKSSRGQPDLRAVSRAADRP